MSLLLDLLYALAVCLGWPLLIVRRIRRGAGSLALGERLGNVPSRPVSATCVWLHGVSLGEVNATRSLVDELRRRAPEAVIVISSTTNTGLKRARELYPDLTVFRFPLDFSFIIRRVLARIRPSVIVLMELEVWPNLVEIAHNRGIPVLIANGRITETGSMRQFRKPVIRWIAARMFGRLDWIGAQEPRYRDRFIALGARPDRVEVVPTLKYDTAPQSEHIEGADELAEDMAIDRERPLVVAGSTGDGEEELILEAFARLRAAGSDLQLALVPRKPERFEEVARRIVERGFICLRREGEPRIPAGIDEPVAVQLGNTMGELRKFYALADVILVGRTLFPVEGSDVIEAAAMGKPLVIGPYYDNFREPVERLLSVGALDVVDRVDRLGEVLEALLADPERRRRMGRAGREAVLAARGVTARTVTAILDRL